MTIYFLGNEGDMTNNNHFPEILCEGDSWFSYPLPPAGNLVNEFDNIYFTGKSIFNTAETGDRIVNIIQGKSRKRLLSNLDKAKGYASLKVLLFSGGGNDFIGNLLSMLEADCSGKTSALACFKAGQLDAQFARIAEAYRQLIALRDLMRPDIPIITHQYDYAIPSDKGVLWFGSWVKPSLDAAQVPVPLQIHVAHLLIDRFIALLAPLEDDRFIVVPTAGTLTEAGDWENEIHPSRQGIAKLTRKFEPVLRRFIK